MKKSHFIAKLSLISLACVSTVYAATPINLNNQPASRLASFIASPISLSKNSSASSIQEINRHVDFNQTAHLRVQQMYQGHPVWGADAVIHVPNNANATVNSLSAASSLNGLVYQDLETDLNKTPAYALSEAQAKMVFNHALELHQKQTGFLHYDKTKTQQKLMVYVDKKQQAHWAYLISFFSAAKDGTPAVPTYIIDATDFTVYAEWNDLQTLQETVKAGGLGGNPKLGKLSYDGMDHHYPALTIQRDDKTKICYLKNKDVAVRDDTNSSGPFDNSPIEKFNCAAKNTDHNNLYWDAAQDKVNQGFSPANDAMYLAGVIKDMYLSWYNVPVLSILGMPMQLVMHAHAKDLYGNKMDNAYFLSFTQEMYFGDGVKLFYPLTSLGVGAHELSHGFTSQHSNLAYDHQSGGLNESFSDMAAQAAEFYSTGKNSWQIGPEIVRGEGALRYMDDPTKDGKSIDNVKDYTDDLNVHYSSGVFNKVFYLLGTTDGWSTKKAFDVMVKANMDYWTSTSTFNDAACGVVKATKDYKYNVADVSKAMRKVGINVNKC